MRPHHVDGHMRPMAVDMSTLDLISYSLSCQMFTHVLLTMGSSARSKNAHYSHITANIHRDRERVDNDWTGGVRTSTETVVSHTMSALDQGTSAQISQWETADRHGEEVEHCDAGWDQCREDRKK